MFRLCFERMPGFEPLETKEEFLAWVEGAFPGMEYRYSGYIVQNLGDMWFGQNVLWNITIENDMNVLARIERNNWMINGYVVHAYHRKSGENEVKINNKAFQISREEARSRAVTA